MLITEKVNILGIFAHNIRSHGNISFVYFVPAFSNLPLVVMQFAPGSGMNEQIVHMGFFQECVIYYYYVLYYYYYYYDDDDDVLYSYRKLSYILAR